jgi:hypothetical protein
VEKLRKPLENKAAVSAAQKTKNTGCVNRKVLLRYWFRQEIRAAEPCLGRQRNELGKGPPGEDGKTNDE